MTRIHSNKRGKSHSRRPITTSSPNWVTYDKDEVVSLIIQFSKDGLNQSQIGLKLRDEYNIPLVKSIVGKSVGKILVDNGDIICGNINGIRDRIPDPEGRVGMSIQREHFTEISAPNGKIIAGDVRETVSLEAGEITALNLVDNVKIKGRKIQIFGQKVSYDVYIELKKGGTIRFFERGSGFDISDDTILKLEDGKEFFLDELKTKKLIGYGGQDITYDFLSNLDTNNSINSNWSTKLSIFRLFKKK